MAEHGSAGGPNAIQRASFSTYVKDALLQVGDSVFVVFVHACVCRQVCKNTGCLKLPVSLEEKLL